MAASQDIPKDLKGALRRLLILEDLDLSKCLKEEQTFHDRITHLKAAHISGLYPCCSIDESLSFSHV